MIRGEYPSNSTTGDFVACLDMGMSPYFPNSRNDVFNSMISRRAMKPVTIILLIMFCALLGVQTACATGWQVHGTCSDEAADQDHCESCHWDPCHQGYNSPVKSKTDDSLPEPFPVAGFTLKTPSEIPTLHAVTSDSPPRATTPRPAGNFPLLI